MSLMVGEKSVGGDGPHRLFSGLQGWPSDVGTVIKSALAQSHRGKTKPPCGGEFAQALQINTKADRRLKAPAPCGTRALHFALLPAGLPAAPFA
jgi:hypothetical protein